MKFFKVLCVLALVFAVSAVAYAETQSVKVSGDIAARAFARDNYDLSKNDLDAVDPASSNQTNNWATFAQSTTEIQVEADLTDNVSGVARLVNQRVWGDQAYTSNNNPELATTNPIRDVPQTRNVAPGADAYQVNMDLAYIELKEFLYSPLTLKIGRQDMWFGKGFIIGNSLQDPNGALYAPEYTAINSFDAVRATVDFDPWTIDVVYAKLGENLYRGDDDVNLYGANIGYVFDSYNAEAEAYYWWKQDRNPTSSTTAASVTRIQSTENVVNNDVHTLGMRGSIDPIEDWTIAAEGAYQAGQFMGIAQQGTTRERSAWALDGIVECRYWQDQFAWKPVGSLEYIWYSGARETGDRTMGTNGVYSGWDPMYRGKFDTAIREFQNVFYATRQASTPSYTNQHQLLLRGTIEPTDSVTFSGTYGNFWLDKVYQTSGPNQNSKTYVGSEVDLEVKWDYTEDVSFGLLSGWFFPGDHFGSNSDDIATDIVGTVKLSF